MMTDDKNYGDQRKRIDFVPVQRAQDDFSSSPSLLTTNKDFQIRSTLKADITNASFLKGQIINRTATGATYSVATTDYLIGITSLVNAPTIGLPRPINVGVGKTYRVKDEVGGAATTNITVRSAGEETIDGASTSTLTTNYQAKSFYTDGTNWFTF